MSKVYHHFTDAAAQNKSFFEHLKSGGKLAIIEFEPRWFLFAPKGTPKSYGGHGIWKKVLIDEVTQAGFEFNQMIENFSSMGMYCAVFTKGKT